MRRLGLLGGMSWESSVEYERTINTVVRNRLGGVASADLVLRSFNFAELEALQLAGRWDDAGDLLAGAAADLVAAGAEAVVICANTMHKVADAVEAAAGVPLIHITDATAARVTAAGLRQVALLGTRYTMEQDFYVGRLRERHGITAIVPNEPQRTSVHDIIYDELVRGIASPGSKRAYLEVIDELVGRGAEAVVAACTEIELLIAPDDVPVPLFPTARIHAEAAVAFALGEA